MDELRLGDIIDDYCIKCRRLTNHAIVSLMEGEVAKVRCRSCYHDHTYLREQAPPSKKDLKKAELFNAVLAQATLPGGSPEADASPDVLGVEVEEAEILPEEPAEDTTGEPVEAERAVSPRASKTPKARQAKK